MAPGPWGPSSDCVITGPSLGLSSEEQWLALCFVSLQHFPDEYPNHFPNGFPVHCPEIGVDVPGVFPDSSFVAHKKGKKS